MPAWRMCVSWTSSLHKPPKLQHFSMQSLLVLQNQCMHLLHYLGGDHELIYQRFLKKLFTFTGLERKYPCQRKGHMVSCSGSQLLKSKYEANHNVAGSNSQTPSKFIELKPTTQHIVFPSASMHFCFLRSPQHFYTNFSLCNFPV